MPPACAFMSAGVQDSSLDLVTAPYGCVSLGGRPCVHAHCSSDTSDWVPMCKPLVSYSDCEMYTQIGP